MKPLKSFKKKNKIILLRVDYNVDFDKKGRVLDDFRIVRTLPTIKYLLGLNSQIVLATHIGRPKVPISDLSTKRLVPHLKKLLKKNIIFLKDFTKIKYKSILKDLNGSSVVLLENLRFFKGEEENSSSFAKTLANLADVFVFDAFSVSHRRHASVVGVPKFLDSYYGFLVEEEITTLKKVLNYKKGPLTLVLGGAKEKTKFPLIKYWLNRADYILLGGVMANNFLKAQGYELGKSLYTPEFVEEAKKILSSKHKAQIILPKDVSLLSFSRKKNSNLDCVGKKDMILDIGKETIEFYKKIIDQSQLIIFNGPMGYFEDKRFKKGTIEVMAAIVNSKAFSVAGGGETLVVLKGLKTKKKFSFVSTGGGAMLEFLSHKPLAISKFIKM